MQTDRELENIDIDALRRDARRYHQLLDHPNDARHLLTLLQAGRGTKTHLDNMLDQLHLQDLAKAGTLAAARIWQQGGADGKTGTARAAETVLAARGQVTEMRTEIVADRIIADSLAVIDAGRLRRAERDGHSYAGPERRAGFRATAAETTDERVKNA